MKLFVFFILSFGFISFAQASANRSAIDEYFGCPSSSFLCKTLNANIDGDTNGCLVKPRDINRFESFRSSRAPASKAWKIDGRINYYDVIRGRYLYKVKRLSSRSYTLHAKVHFKNKHDFSPLEIDQYRKKIERAAEIWTKNNTFNNNISFKFDIAEKADSKTVSARLIRPYTRGPYFSKWSLNWDVETIAHEFGHVMGLRDEYEYFDDHDRSNNCSSSSLMCNSYGRPQEHHYFLIFQRSFCEV